MTHVCDIYVVRPTPVGPARVVLGPAGVRAVRLGEPDDAVFARAYEQRFNRAVRPGRVPVALVAAIDRALASGDSADLPVDLGDLTPFRREVLAVTARIPCGEVRSYTWVAEAVGRPNAPRAVGAALAANPVPLIIPCHRVVRRSGDPGGYAFGAATKVALLAAEGPAVVVR